MGYGRSHRSIHGITANFGVPYIAVALAALGCTTTLDPSIDVRGVEVGAGGEAGEPPGTCRLFSSATSEYTLCRDPVDHETAAVDCTRRNASLASISSIQENDFVATNSESVLMGDWWLGGTRDDAFVWTWPDGSVFWRGGPDGMAEDGAFVRWKPGEPNNASTTSPDPERCLVITPADDWNDRACTLRVPYVCERPL
jgi:hypothetical protein